MQRKQNKNYSIYNLPNQEVFLFFLVLPLIPVFFLPFFPFPNKVSPTISKSPPPSSAAVKNRRGMGASRRFFSSSASMASCSLSCSSERNMESFSSQEKRPWWMLLNLGWTGCCCGCCDCGFCCCCDCGFCFDWERPRGSCCPGILTCASCFGCRGSCCCWASCNNGLLLPL